MGRKSNYTHGRTRDHCYFCGAFGGIEEHHVIPQRFDGADDPDNIVGLCSTCHTKLERLYDKSFYEWFGIEDEEGERRTHIPCQMPECNNRSARKIQRHAGVLPIRMCESCAKDAAKKNGMRRYRGDSINEILEDITVVEYA